MAYDKSTTLFDVLNAIEAYSEILNESKTEKAPTFWKPYHVCLLTMAMRSSALSAGFNPSEYSLTDARAETIQYLSRMHLWHALDVDPPVRVRERDCSGQFMPLKKLIVSDEVQEISNQLRLIMRNADKDTVDSAEIMLSEILGNCFAHSESKGELCGLVCAQNWQKAGFAQIAILDTGIGIRASLSQSENHAETLNHRNSCEYATEERISSKLNRNHSGYGLTLAKQLIQNNGGTFVLASGDEFFISRRGNLDHGIVKSPFQGTLVILEWNTNVPLDSKAVYDSWPPSDGEENDYDF